MPIIPPGSKKFKLRKLDSPIILDKDHRYTQVCDELASDHTCHDGMIFVAYGEKNNVYDVYSFLCKICTGSGYEWWELDDVNKFKNKPPAYSCLEKDIPGNVFIHPVHASTRMKKINHMIKFIIDQKAIVEEEGLPF